MASTVDPPRAALASLESSGRLGALRNQELVTALASWLALLDDLQGDEELVARRLEENLYPYLNSHVALRTVSSFDKGHLAGEPSSFPNGLMEVLASREFENLLDLRRTDSRIIMDDYDAVRASLARVRSLIEQEAGLDIGLTGNVSLVLDGFYNLGVKKIDDSGIDDDTKNRAFSILAGLSFSVSG